MRLLRIFEKGKDVGTIRERPDGELTATGGARRILKGVLEGKYRKAGQVVTKENIFELLPVTFDGWYTNAELEEME